MEEAKEQYIDIIFKIKNGDKAIIKDIYSKTVDKHAQVEFTNVVFLKEECNLFYEKATFVSDILYKEDNYLDKNVKWHIMHITTHMSQRNNQIVFTY